MTSAARSISLSRLKRRALSLGAVKAFDQAMQFVLPVVLARSLDAATFGEYRLLWLAVSTVMALATLNMAGSLYYFVPRSDARAKKVYIHNTVAYFVGAGVLFLFLAGPWNPLLPQSMAPLVKYGELVPVFIALWFVATVLDCLPTIEERIRWQAWVSMSTALLRVVLVAAAALFSGELEAILWALMAVVLVRLGLLAFYVHRHHGLGRPWFEGARFREQLRYSLPFGLSTMFFSLRGQADQWIAATLFAITSFASFTIAALVGQIVHIFRHSVMEAFLPSMSRMEAAGDVRGMMDMNARANALVGTLIYPLLAIAFVYAEDLVSIVYTSTYVEAGPVMRVYIAGMVGMVVEVGSIVLLLRQGRFVLLLGPVLLAASVALSWAMSHRIGLAGAAIGSMSAIYLDRALVLTRVSRHTGIPFAQLQRWRELGWALATSAAAALLAWAFTYRLLPDAPPLVRVAAGSAVLILTYAALNYRRVRK